MYAEIGKNYVDLHWPRIEEGRVYLLRRFRVSAARCGYRAVKGDVMIEFTSYTVVDEVADVPVEFSKVACDPVPFPDLPDFIGDVSRFVGTFSCVL